MNQMSDAIARAIDSRKSTPAAPAAASASAYTPKERLEATARAAIKAHPNNWDAARDFFFKAVKDKPELLWAMLEPYRASVAQGYLSAANEAVRATLPRPERTERPPAASQMSTAELGEKFRRGAQALAQVTSKSLLDTFKIGTRSIGDVTPRLANKWADGCARNAAFVRRLTENLPADQPIRKYRSADDAAKAMAGAEKDHA